MRSRIRRTRRKNVVSTHELLTDAIAAGDANAAVAAIMAWKETSRAGIHTILGDVDEAHPTGFQPAGVIEDLTIAQAKEQSAMATALMAWYFTCLP